MLDDLLLGAEEFQENRWCPACRSTASQSLMRHREQLPRRQTFPRGTVTVADEVRLKRELLLCMNCGLWYMSHVPCVEAIEYLHEVPGYAELLRPDARRKTFQRAYEALESIGMVCGRILDVGAHTGEFLRGLEGWDRNAIEPIGVSRERLHFVNNVYSGYIDRPNSLPDDYFDVVSMFDVAEHLYDVHAAWANVARCLKPGGVLLIETGDTDSRIARRQLAWWYYVHWYGHFVFHSRRSLQYSLTANDLYPLSFTQVHHLEPSISDIVRAGLRLVAFQIVTAGGSCPQNWTRMAARFQRKGAIPMLPWKDHLFVVARKA